MAAAVAVVHIPASSNPKGVTIHAYWVQAVKNDKFIPSRLKREAVAVRSCVVDDVAWRWWCLQGTRELRRRRTSSRLCRLSHGRRCCVADAALALPVTVLSPWTKDQNPARAAPVTLGGSRHAILLKDTEGEGVANRNVEANGGCATSGNTPSYTCFITTACSVSQFTSFINNAGSQCVVTTNIITEFTGVPQTIHSTKVLTPLLHSPAPPPPSPPPTQHGNRVTSLPPVTHSTPMRAPVICSFPLSSPSPLPAPSH
ncbi:hypothetical protein E2C01_023639 [Portunus trituberculatus]|uniref:Uncharacterized protein n=1 Tax=Portunus trituberculatus TaxID=210409 RepID=A0A5B7EB35_PORTR|nr:hypothetical protein [Portunus trituberculatus]